jgi:hypothetical protein
MIPGELWFMTRRREAVNDTLAITVVPAFFFFFFFFYLFFTLKVNLSE